MISTLPWPPCSPPVGTPGHRYKAHLLVRHWPWLYVRPTHSTRGRSVMKLDFEYGSWSCVGATRVQSSDVRCYSVFPSLFGMLSFVSSILWCRAPLALRECRLGLRTQDSRSDKSETQCVGLTSQARCWALFLADGLVKNQPSLSRDGFIGLKWGKVMQCNFFDKCGKKPSWRLVLALWSPQTLYAEWQWLFPQQRPWLQRKQYIHSFGSSSRPNTHLTKSPKVHSLALNWNLSPEFDSGF